MPEGDTIYRTARVLEKALAGRVVVSFETGLAKVAAVDDETPLVGRVVERVESRGKWCLIFFSGDLILASHMLMSGSWHVYRVGEKWQRPRSQMRVVIEVGALPQGLKPLAFVDENGTPEGVPLRNNSGFVAVLFGAQVVEFFTARGLERSAVIPRLGPDVLSAEFTQESGVRALREYAAAHPEEEVGLVLLNQRVMAGLGNVYKSEVAFAAGVNPFRAVGTLTVREMETMVEFAQRWMKSNVRDGADEGIVTYSGQRRTTGAMRQGDRLWVYKRAGQECRRCGAVILMRKQGVGARVTFWCPGCQPMQ